jgi:hypothetical protein
LNKFSFVINNCALIIVKLYCANILISFFDTSTINAYLDKFDGEPAFGGCFAKKIRKRIECLWSVVGYGFKPNPTIDYHKNIQQSRTILCSPFFRKKLLRVMK